MIWIVYANAITGALFFLAIMSVALVSVRENNQAKRYTLDRIQTIMDAATGMQTADVVKLLREHNRWVQN